MPGAAARILVAAAVPGKNGTVVWYYIRNCMLLQSDPRSIKWYNILSGLAPGAAGLVRAAAAVRAAVAAAPAPGEEKLYFAVLSRN